MLSRATPFVVSCAILAFFVSAPPATAQTFNEASTRTLNLICTEDSPFVVQEEGQFNLQPNLAAVCSSILLNAAGSSLSSSGSGASPQSPGALAIEQRLQSVREAEEERSEGGAAAGLLAFNGASGPVMDVQEFGRVPARGGPTIFGLGEGFSVFLSAGAQALNHHNNRFEDGYAAQLPTVTIGADYRLGGRFLVGLAFNYTNFSGDYDDGGDFDRNLFSPLLYATVIPFQGAFADIVLGYTRQDNSYRRRAKAVITRALGVAELGTTFEGDASADYNGNTYSAGALFGYDHQFGAVTVGPRIGVNFAHQQTDNFEESGDTGLELKYRSLNRTSVQSSLGARGAVTVPIATGVLVPQVAASWVHEYADNARNIEAQYIEASPSPWFTFQREPPARNWATIDAGVVYQPYDSLFQIFANFSTMQGNVNFVSYGGTLGVRAGF